MRWKRALVTGASSGIGRAMSNILADEGTHLVVVARDRERLEALAAQLSVDVEIIVADLSDPADVATVAQRIAAEPPVDLVVNNAGWGTYGGLSDQSIESQQNIIAVNVGALVHLSQVAAQAFGARGCGTILNVSSVAAFMAAPNTAIYNASKAFVTSFTEALHGELEADGVRVSCLCPGFTRTEFQKRAAYDTSQVPDRLWQSARDVAMSGLDGAAANRVVVVPGAHNKVAVKGLKLLPGAVRRRLTAAVDRD